MFLVNQTKMYSSTIIVKIAIFPKVSYVLESDMHSDIKQANKWSLSCIKLACNYYYKRNKYYKANKDCSKVFMNV